MKAIIGVLLFVAFLAVWALSSSNNEQSQLKIFDLLKLPVPQTFAISPISNPSESPAPSYLQGIESIGEIEQQFVSFKDVDLRNEISKIEGDSETSELIKQANLRPLTKSEFKNLAFQLRKKSALHKILLDRALDEQDKSL